MQFKLVHLILLTLLCAFLFALSIKLTRSYPMGLFVLSTALTILVLPAWLLVSAVSMFILFSADPWEVRVSNFVRCWRLCLITFAFVCIPWLMTLVGHLANLT